MRKIGKKLKKFYDVHNFGVPEQITDMQDSLEMILKRRDIQIYNYVDFSDFNEIGRGNHNVVYSAEYRGEIIAFKEFTKREDKIILVNELKRHIMVNNHENIIKFLGITA
ncbi:40729_t:CDS:2, partial [Gigaspora margarita]